MFGLVNVPYSEPIIKPRPHRRFLRGLRAMWRDSTALWHEFQRPILIFLLVTFIGGYIYGELHVIAGIEDPPYIELIDRPYIMFQLMILESPYDVPSQWYLVIWWYLLPFTLIFIIGDGVAEFVKLFFDRDQRGQAWREALVSTYRHHVIVLGAGHVGLRVMRVLRALDVEVVIIDNSPDVGVEDELKRLGAVLILGDGREISTLQKAGLRHADAFIACTGNDHINLDVIMRVRSANENIRIVARVWDDEFAQHIMHFMQVQSVLSSSDLAAPAFAGLALGVEISQSLRVGKQDYSTVRLTVQPGSFLDGVDVGTLQRENEMDIVLLNRGGEEGNDIQPARDEVVRAGDTLVIFSEHDRSFEIALRNHQNHRN